MELSRSQWLQAIGLTSGEVPEVMIMEGSWWTKKGTRERLAWLDDVKELNFPEIHHGYYKGHPVAYSCATYGAPRAVEPVHFLSCIGCRTFVQIGTCGGIAPGLVTGDIVLPQKAAIGEGASQYYAHVDYSYADETCLKSAIYLFAQRGVRVHSGLHFTTSALFAQSDELVSSWRKKGYLGVDMETSAVFSAAGAMGVRAVSLLFVWDELVKKRTFLDGYSDEERLAQKRANDLIFEVALDLMEFI